MKARLEKGRPFGVHRSVYKRRGHTRAVFWQPRYPVKKDKAKFAQKLTLAKSIFKEVVVVADSAAGVLAADTLAESPELREAVSLILINAPLTGGRNADRMQIGKTDFYRWKTIELLFPEHYHSRWAKVIRAAWTAPQVVVVRYALGTSTDMWRPIRRLKNGMSRTIKAGADRLVFWYYSGVSSHVLKELSTPTRTLYGQQNKEKLDRMAESMPTVTVGSMRDKTVFDKDARFYDHPDVPHFAIHGAKHDDLVVEGSRTAGWQMTHFRQFVRELKRLKRDMQQTDSSTSLDE